MTTQQVESLTCHAKDIYARFCAQIHPIKFSDWQPLAAKAFEAAEVFAAVSEKRYASQALTSPVRIEVPNLQQQQPPPLPPEITGYGQQPS